MKPVRWFCVKRWFRCSDTWVRSPHRVILVYQMICNNWYLKPHCLTFSINGCCMFACCVLAWSMHLMGLPLLGVVRQIVRDGSLRWSRIRSPATFFGSGFEFSGKTGSVMYGMICIECKVCVCK